MDDDFEINQMKRRKLSPLWLLSVLLLWGIGAPGVYQWSATVNAGIPSAGYVIAAAPIFTVVSAVILAIWVMQNRSVGRQVERLSTKSCPDCAEEVKAAARKCKHCGYAWEE